MMLKDLDEHGWWFGTSSNSAKGRQLATTRAAAHTFYWPLVGRQVRVRGAILAGSAAQSAADFRARGVGAQAVALASRESEPLPDRATCVDAVRAAEQRFAAAPDLVGPDWQAYAVAPTSVEFWQADKDRLHTRVRYERDGAIWAYQMLWP